MISRKTLLRNVAGFFVSAKELKERGFKFFKLLVFCHVCHQTQTSKLPLGQMLNHPTADADLQTSSRPNVESRNL